MHTTVETVAKSDVEHVINLILETIKVIESDQDFRYIK
jgi:putative aminopeptidase FrvX